MSTGEEAPVRPRPPRTLALVAAVVGVTFAGPLVYIVWRNVSHGSDLAAELLSRDTL